MSDQWKEVAQPGAVSVWKPDINEELVGTLTLVSHDVGMNKATTYEITTDDDEKVMVWSSKVIASKLDQLPIGSKVKMVYLGKQKSKNGPGSYHNYKIYTQSPEMADIIKKEEESGDAIPF